MALQVPGVMRLPGSHFFFILDLLMLNFGFLTWATLVKWQTQSLGKGLAAMIVSNSTRSLIGLCN